jgi:hypothetical protein
MKAVACACIRASALASNIGIGIHNGSSAIVVSKRRAWL